MKSLPKFLIIFFLSIFIFQLACLLFLLALPNIGQAADQATFKPQVEIPGLDKELQKTSDKQSYLIPGSTEAIAKYIRAIYKYAIGIVGILAAVVLMIGGVMWIMAGGSATAIGEAKAWIGASLTGLLLALLSYVILATVNPALVDFRVTPVQNVKEIKTSKFDANTECGVQLPGYEGACGQKCPSGQACQKVPEGTSGAKNCIYGSDNWWLCSSLSINPSGTNACCTDNNNAQCPAGYVCNMQMITGACVGKGTCATKQNINGICGENNDCISNNCDSGIFATNKCR